MNLKNKAAIYIRVSTQFQVDKDSLLVQRRELMAYSQLVLGINDFDVFEDPGYSGKDTSRPAYQKMMGKLRTGEYSHLLVWKIDRISRNLLDFASMYSELKRIGVTFVSKNEQFDTSTAIGEAMLKIILVFAELERKMTAERVTAVMISRATNGQWNGGRVPFGYDWDKKEKVFTVNEKEADIYRFICSQYEEKQSILKVCKELNSRGITTKTGGKWNTVGVHKVLTNVFYKGVYRYNVHSDGRGNAKRDRSEWIDIENHHPALIDESRFNRISYLLKKNVRKGAKRGDSYTGKTVHIFAGLLVCGKCGANMTASKDRIRADGYRPSIYGCASRKRNATNCVNKFVSDMAIAKTVFSTISGILKATQNHATSETDISWLIKSSGLPSQIVRVEGLDRFAESINSGVSGMKYTPVFAYSSKENRGASVLKSRRKSLESSLSRLQSLYVYGEEAISEKDYILERRRITDEIDEIDSSLKESSEIDAEISEKDFLVKASYFVMVENLMSGKCENAGELLRSMDPYVPKDFLRALVSKIMVEDGCVKEMEFKNGFTIRFIYE